MKIVTRATAIKNLKKYIGKDLAELAPQFGINPYLNGKQNKGWKGLVLERLAGLQTNVSKAPNGLTYELKSVAFHKIGGALVPKETIVAAKNSVQPSEGAAEGVCGGGPQPRPSKKQRSARRPAC